jgi:hypothetical protein
MSKALINATETKFRQLTHRTPIAKLYGTRYIKTLKANGSNCTVFTDGKHLQEERLVSDTFAAMNILTNGGYVDFLIELNVKAINGTDVDATYAQSFRVSQIVEAQANNEDSDVKIRSNNRVEDDVFTVDETLAAIMLLVPGDTTVTKGTVTQITAITTGVEVNASSGVITTVSSTLAAGANATFIVTNSAAAADSVIQLTVDDSATAGLAKLNVQAIGAGVFSVNITNIHTANAFNNVMDIHFSIT